MQNITIWNEKIEKLGLNMNTGKTLSYKDWRMQINNVEIEQVTEFKFLGAIIIHEET